MMACSNPFSTRFVRPDASEFLYPASSSADELLERWRRLGRRASIIGPHGVGKSTLMQDLCRRIAAQGSIVKLINADRRRGVSPRELGDRCNMVAMDGWEQCTLPQRWQWSRWARHREHGLLVTTHRRSGLPTLIQLEPRVRVLRAVVKRLVEKQEFDDALYMRRWNEESLERLLQKCGGSLREALFALYDDWEINANVPVLAS